MNNLAQKGTTMSMSSEETRRIPQQARSIEKKKRILEAATILIGSKGFQGTNAKEIAKEAGVSVGTFYAYFKDKKTVLMEMLGQHMAEVDQSIFQQLESMIKGGATGRDVMRKVVELGDASHHQPPALLRTLLAMRYTDEDIAQFSQAENEALIAKLVALLKTMRAQLRVTDLEAAARVVVYAFEETMHSVAISENGIEKQRLYDALTDLMSTYLYKNPDSYS